MDIILRAVVVYAILLIVFRIGGKRSLAQITTFDFVLLLVIGGATQQAMLGDDFSLTTAALAIITLIGLDVGVSLLKHQFPRIGPWVDDMPVVIVEDGKPITERLEKARVDEADILESARANQGIERMDQIKYAVLERTGSISIVPRQQS